MPGEAPREHARLAAALADAPDASAAEIASHWELAGDVEQEIRWRIAAALAARARFGLEHEAVQWRRVLELWPDPEATYGDPAYGGNQGSGGWQRIAFPEPIFPPTRS